MHCRCRLLYHCNHHWKCEGKCHDAVTERMDVEYYRAWMSNHHLAVDWLRRILAFLCDCDGGEWWQSQWRWMSSCSKKPSTNIHDSVITRNVAAMIRSVSMLIEVLIPWRAGWALEKAAPRFTFSKTDSYCSHKISLILLHSFGKCSISLSLPTSLGSRNEYHICIQLVAAIILHPHKTLLLALPD